MFESLVFIQRWRLWRWETFKLQRTTFSLLLLPHQEVYLSTCWYSRSPHTSVCWQTESAPLSPVLLYLFECICCVCVCVCVTEWEDNPSAGRRSQFPESHFDCGSHRRQHCGGCWPQVCYCHRIRYVCVTVPRLSRCVWSIHTKLGPGSFDVDMLVYVHFSCSDCDWLMIWLWLSLKSALHVQCKVKASSSTMKSPNMAGMHIK